MTGCCPYWAWPDELGDSAWETIRVLSSMEEGKAKLVLVCPDLSQRTLKGIESRAEAFGVPLVTIEQTMDQVSMSLGKRCGVLALNDEGFARKALDAY